MLYHYHYHHYIITIIISTIISIIITTSTRRPFARSKSTDRNKYYCVPVLKSPAMATPTAEIQTVGFYNVGIQQSAFENRKKAVVEERLRQLANDIANCFHNHRLDMLAICELGGHTRGLSAKMHFPDLDTQKKLMKFIIDGANGLKVSAEEPDLVLVSGDIPSYAVIRTETTKLQVEDVVRVRHLDKRPGDRR